LAENFSTLEEGKPPEEFLDGGGRGSSSIGENEKGVKYESKRVAGGSKQVGLSLGELLFSQVLG